jgi:hypothetical protein
MIESYAFLAMVMMQILVGSVLDPALLFKRLRPTVAACMFLEGGRCADR